jgi:hypothetical protein
MKIKSRHPRLYFDCNSQLAERSFALVQGTLDELQALKLTPESALGMRFTFVQEETGPSGGPDALVCDGTIACTPSLGHFALADPGGVKWVSEIVGHEA